MSSLQIEKKVIDYTVKCSLNYLIVNAKMACGKD